MGQPQWNQRPVSGREVLRTQVSSNNPYYPTASKSSESSNKNSNSFQDDSYITTSSNNSSVSSASMSANDNHSAALSSSTTFSSSQKKQQLEQQMQQQQQADLQYRLVEPMTLRKNLDLSTFQELEQSENESNQSENDNKSHSKQDELQQQKQLSVSAKIAHYEQQAAASLSTTTATNSTSTSTTTTTTATAASLKPPKVQQPPVEGRSLSVYLRLRPLVAEMAGVSASTVQVVPSGSQLYPSTKIRTHAPSSTSSATANAASTAANACVKEYEFTRVFDAETSQQAFYRETTAPLVRGLFGVTGTTAGTGTTSSDNNNSAPAAESALLLAYGITNAGKTHTVLGPSAAFAQQQQQKSSSSDHPAAALQLPAEWGLIPRALADLLQRVEQVNHNNNNKTPKTKTTLHMSYFEIYKDQVFDLLPRNDSTTTKSSSSLFVKQAALKVGEYQGQVMVRGLTRHSVDNLKVGLGLVQQAKLSRHTATNHLNPHSSRSHCVCQFTVSTSDVVHVAAKPDASTTAISDEKHLWMVDLAGSERSKRTGVGGGSLRQKEASWINQSLMTLMRCLQVLRENQESSSSDAVVPYRDCKLTHLLSSHWTGGKVAGRTTMVVNVHPGAEDYNETQHVLQYAASAKTIVIQKAVTAVTSVTAGATTAAAAEYGYNGRKKETKKRQYPAKTVQSQIAKIVRKLSPKKLRGHMQMQRNRKRKSVVVVETAKNGQLSVSVSASGVATTTANATTERTAGQWMPAAKRRRAGEKATDNNNNSDNSAKAASIVPGFLNGGNSFAASDSKEMKSLKMTLSIAQAESQVLRQEKKELEEQLEETETAVRVEVAEEMDEQMKAMREQYQDIIDRLKSKMHAPPEQSRSAKKVQMDRAAEKLDDLLCKVEECEEEMARMREEHQQEVDDVVHKYGTTLKAKAEELRAMTERGEQMQAQVQQLQGELERANKKNAGSEGVVVSDDRVRSLERELDASRAQVKKLERSKKELIDNYEKLLRDAGDDDDDGDDEDDSDGNEEEEEEESSDVEEAPSPTPKKDTRRLTRRQIQQSEVALPPSKAKAKQTTRSSTRRPLGSVSSNVKRSESSLSDDSFGPSQWLFPKTKTKKDPETGTFLRPRGRAPIGVDTWDGSKGAWRLSVA